VGVEPAHGVYREDAPALGKGKATAFFKTALTDFLHGVQHMVQEVAKGKFVPTIVAYFKEPPAMSAEIEAATNPWKP
jgi:hypothetical protein